MENRAAQHQPQPTRSDRAAIQDLVIEDFRIPYKLLKVPIEPDVQMVIDDIEARKQVGLERYGTLLQAFNGRDVLMDAYQEALDLVVYTRQAIEEHWNTVAEERKTDYGVLALVYENAQDMALILRREIAKRDA